jgi:hypothetical protein
MSSPPVQFAAAYNYQTATKGVTSVLASAEIVVPLLNSVFQPASVIDLGCGTGDWLSVWKRHAVSSVKGYDGVWVPPSALVISEDEFNAVDFCAAIPDMGFADLAMCLEVAEHVPASVGKQFVSVLCRTAPVIVWSAAVPGQGGYGHVNEQYLSYWVQEFANKPFDIIRPKIWSRSDVAWWYQQNLLVFASTAAQLRFNLSINDTPLPYIHPCLYEQARDPRNYSIRRMLPHFGFYMTKAIDLTKVHLGFSRRS